MAHEQLRADEPDIGFDTYAAGAQGGVERGEAPVVVVRVAWDGEDVARKVGWVVCGVGADVVGLAPGLQDAVDAGGKDGGWEIDEEGEQLEYAAVRGGKELVWVCVW